MCYRVELGKRGVAASATGVSGERPTDGLGSPAVVGARPTLATALTLLKIDQKCEIFCLPFLQICDDMCLFLHDLCGCVICVREGNNCDTGQM